ncbi:hypothetical protein JW906_09650 [bacterium]|nr:hypothetical protein [bacterium]
MKKKMTLNPLETAIESESRRFVPIGGRRRKRIEEILENTRKTRNINIRISEMDLAQLKQRSEAEGIPYQTLISSVLHKYVRNRLVDEKEILKSIKLLTQSD